MPTAARLTDDGREMLLARYTWTSTGYPLTTAEAQQEFGKGARPAPERGWFWLAATPTSAARIRAHGHKAIGSAVTTWIPPQTPIKLSDEAEPEGNMRARTNSAGATVVAYLSCDS